MLKNLQKFWKQSFTYKQTFNSLQAKLGGVNNFKYIFSFFVLQKIKMDLFFRNNQIKQKAIQKWTYLYIIGLA